MIECLPRTGKSNMVTLSTFTLFVLLGIVESSRPDRSVFPSDNDSTFNHLAIDLYHGFVFVGGVNRLYQLNDNLRLIEKYETGPRLDSLECPISGDCASGATKNLTNNFNKALVVDNSTGHPRLISCGSIFQGLCLVHNNIRNISSEVVQINQSVVANDAGLSTVAFIGPGPSNSFVFYVAATIINNSVYRSEMPMIASRSLETDRLLMIAVDNVPSGTKLMSLPNSKYIVDYIYGFSAGSFTYFLTTQNESDQSSFVSKLVRICNEDDKYYSYTEIPIKCTSAKDGRDYNLARAAFIAELNPEHSTLLGLNTNLSSHALFVVFSLSKSNDSSEQSALCIYSLRQTNEIFIQNIRQCITTGGYRGLENIVKDHQCTKVSPEMIKDDFCKLDFDIQLEGNTSVTAEALITNDSLELTAVAAAAMGTPNHIMLFLGTSKGHLKKILVKNPLDPMEIDDIYIDDSSVSRDILFDSKMIHLYAMTKTKLMKVKVHECSQYNTCNSCLLAKDPECGWCLRQHACTLKTACIINSSDEVSWSDRTNGSCSSMISLKPKHVSYDVSENLRIIVDNFPNLNDQLRCNFTILNQTFITNATRGTNATSIHCNTPEPQLLSSLKPVDEYFITKLSLDTISHPDLVSTNITFFYCGTYSCNDCISSKFPCNWCSTKHQCVYGYDRNQNSNVILRGENCDKPNTCSQGECCPMINSTDDGTNVIIIGNGTSQSIKFNIIPGYIENENFSCKFSFEDRTMIVPATLGNNYTLHCNETIFGYSQWKNSSKVTFEVLWGAQRTLENPHNIQIVIYKCSEMSPNCLSCLALEKKYQCGWCENTDQCEIHSRCEKGSKAWLNQTSKCLGSNITFFEPRCGLWNDHINVTIRGTNLGVNINEDRNITVANVSCIESSDLAYRSHPEIICQLNHPENVPLKGRVEIKMRLFSIYSDQDFTFFDSEITDIFPNQGPKSGGTKLTIKGESLCRPCNTNSTEVIINKINCIVIFQNSSVVMCITGKSNNTGDCEVTVKCGGNGNIRTNKTFKYANDPVIKFDEISNLEGRPAGGNDKIHVQGKYFELIQKPLFFVYNEDETKRFYGACNASNDSMTCEIPQIPDYCNLTINPNHPKRLHFGFEMDGVDNVQNIFSDASSKFLLYPNPTFHTFFDGKKYDPDDEKTLSFDGENIIEDLKSKISVKIGNNDCKIESLSNNSLTCHLPEHNGTKGSKAISDSLEVVVYVGPCKTVIGKLIRDPPTTWFMYILYLCAAVVILSSLFILTIFYKKSSKTTRNLKKIRKELDELELVVTKEARSAFMNLQTEITDLTTNITFGGIPFLDYHTYAMNVMFPNRDHFAILAENTEIIEKKEGLQLFGQLINNRTFLLTFIQTLESNDDFSMTDRVHVATMIMVTLQNNMEYCTDILKTLLTQLIEKSMQNGIHPKLLLRQSESVVEKMLSIWFTFLLYKFLIKTAGQPLYKLFAAIKQYLNKGPIDAITCEARHALSEDKIIRQHIGEYKTMNLYVSVPPQTAVITGLELTVEDMPIEVLDCDTISQVKDKAIEVIYSNVRYSARPVPSEMELEWLIDKFSEKFLFDDDESSKIEGEWRQKNTLKHYQVPDGSMFKLVLVKNTTIHNASTLSASSIGKSRRPSTDSKKKVFSGSSWKSIKSRSLPANAKGVMYKPWHLSKPIDHSDIVPHQNRSNDKMVSEIYLTRLLATKLVLQKFVDDLFEAIFDAKLTCYSVPPSIKYIFDFLDHQALRHGITDPDVVHTWKSNCLPLRFWINLIKNPDFLFDIHKSNVVDSCLGVIAQAFMDSCSTSELHLSEDSPTTKLLYAKDIPINKKKVKQYYADIKSLPSISNDDMNAILNEESRLHACEFNINSSLYALHEYAVKYDNQLMVSLMEDESAQEQKLAFKLEKAHYMIHPIQIDT